MPNRPGQTVKQGGPGTEFDRMTALRELALDLRSAWHHGADVIWQEIDASLWEATRNPWAVFQTASRGKLERLLDNEKFRVALDRQVEMRRASEQEATWFQSHHAEAPLTQIAYFSMEFMLSEALPIYSGGLGNVAGDQLKAANDLGVPVVGVGLLFQQGYFRQLVDASGNQLAVHPYNDPGQLPITPLREADGEWLRLKLQLPGHSIWLRTWQARVGRLRLLLLDSNDAANYPPYRGITAELYGGGPQLRLMQEMVLGIGGWQLLERLGIDAEVCHLNEGHAAFVVLERARSFMRKTGVSFDVALATTRAGNVFTTHTAVPAGFDCFTPAQIKHCLAAYAEAELGISLQALLALGRRVPSNDSASFNMAYLAVRGSGAVNGVSRLHGQVSRKLFGPLFSRWPLHEVPVGHVTNGVHAPTWDSAAADALWTEACGQNRWGGTMQTLGHDMCCVSDERLWKFRETASRQLVTYIRERLARQLEAAGSSDRAIAAAGKLLDPKALTLGFARRFATYKRPNLLLHEPSRLLRLLSEDAFPMQVVVAGKAHPADLAGQALIRQWIEFAHLPEARERVVFLSDYDMHVAEQLVQGVDVWINTPRRPWEASGTSGMKVLVNGGINLSELDGWWAEAYDPKFGWALGDGNEHNEEFDWDAREADALYVLLETEVIPEFYERDANGVPRAWVARMRNSMAELTPRFSTNRTVREYTERYYLPAAQAYRDRAAAGGAGGARVSERCRALDRNWNTIRFGSSRVSSAEGRHDFEIEVLLGRVSPDVISVELYADGVDQDGPIRLPMSEVDVARSSLESRFFGATVSTTRPAADFTARVVPKSGIASVPLEAASILWQK